MARLPEHLVLDAAGLLLRSWRPEDASAIEPACGEWLISNFTSVPWRYTPSAGAAWIERQRALAASGDAVSLAIVEPESGGVAGCVILFRLGAGAGPAELGYWLVPAARGRGLAARAGDRLVRWGFEDLGLERIRLLILPQNGSSLRVAGRLGAVREGLRRAGDPAGDPNHDMVELFIWPGSRPESQPDAASGS